MQRKEQIQDAAADHRDWVCCGFIDPVADARQESFVEGAEWADEHPNSKNVYTKQQLLDMGFAFTTNGDIVTPEQSNEDLKKYLQYQKQKFVKKAREWLSDNKDNYIIDIEGETLVDDRIITDFCTIMEE